MRLRKLRFKTRRLPHLMIGIGILVLFFGIAAPVWVPALVHAAMPDPVTLRSVELSDPTASATDVKYKFSFTTQTAGTLGSITFEICSNYLFNVTDVCSPPPGFSASGATLTSQTGPGDFSMSGASTASKLILTRSPTSEPTQPMTFEFSGITNPSDIGSFYVHIATFSSSDGSGPELDFGNVVFATDQDITITTEVPPYLLFCVGLTIQGYNCGTAEGDLIDFGELSTHATRSGSSQMLASTNAPYGYSVTLAGTTMTSGNNIIPAMTGSSSQIGVSQFGLNAVSNGNPVIGADPDGPGMTVPKAGYNTPDQFRFVSGDIITSSNTTDDYRKFTVSYIVNRDANQAPGKYVATISYICLANF